MILDEAETKLLNEMDEKENNGADNSDKSEENDSQNSSSSEGGSADDKSGNKKETTKRRNLGQKRTNATPNTSGSPLNEDERSKFEKDYADLTITGKSAEYYKSNSTLEFMKEHQEHEYATLDDFKKKLLSKITKSRN